MSVVFIEATMLLTLLLSSFVSAHALSSRIVGGSTGAISKYPYQVSIQYNGLHYCGGSIIHKEWIVTAAHCLFGKNPKLFKVRVGSNYNDRGGKLIEGISTIISHELYDMDSYDYDVGLIKLPSPLTLSSTVNVVALATPTTSVNTGSTAVVTGWGKTTASGNMSNVLQFLLLPVFDQKECEKIYMRHNIITRNMMCAGYTEGGKDTCQGDSGGPLVHNGVQIGIISWGALCAKPGYPGVYTRISAVRNWITKRTNV